MCSICEMKRWSPDPPHSGSSVPEGGKGGHPGCGTGNEAGEGLLLKKVLLVASAKTQKLDAE